MNLTRRHLLFLLFFVVAAPLLAERYEFPEVYCSIRIPERGWVRDTSSREKVLLVARGEDSERVVVVAAVRADDDMDIHDKQFTDGLLKGTARYLSVDRSGPGKLGGIDAFEIVAHAQDAERVLSVVTVSNGFVYNVITRARNVDPARDSLLRAIVASFGFIGEPPASSLAGRSEAYKLGYRMGEGLFWGAILGGGIYFVVRRLRRR